MDEKNLILWRQEGQEETAHLSNTFVQMKDSKKRKQKNQQQRRKAWQEPQIIGVFEGNSRPRLTHKKENFIVLSHVLKAYPAKRHSLKSINFYMLKHPACVSAIRLSLMTTHLLESNKHVADIVNVLIYPLYSVFVADIWQQDFVSRMTWFQNGRKMKFTQSIDD